jgi:hypothetical protein
MESKTLNTSSSSALAARKNGLDIIPKLLSLFDDSLERSPDQSDGPVLVAIDAENMSNKRQHTLCSADCQVGVAICDPKQSSRMIKTYNFVSGSAEYCSKVMPRFLFGKSVQIEKNDIGKHINSIYPESRDVILVGHSLHTELLMLEALHISLPFTCGVDTQWIAKEAIPELIHPPSLSYLGNMLSIPMNFLHCAGNDAHFTLVALLGLACFRSDPESNSESWRKVSSSFQELKVSIAKIKLPIGMDRKDVKKNMELRERRRLANERNQESKHAFRMAEKQTSEVFDWSSMLNELSSLYNASI